MGDHIIWGRLKGLLRSLDDSSHGDEKKGMRDPIGDSLGLVLFTLHVACSAKVYFLTLTSTSKRGVCLHPQTKTNLLMQNS